MPIIPVDQKFHTLDSTTPTPERGSTRTNSMHEIYTMQDIIDTVAGGGEIDFIELGDTPNSYPLGSAGQAVIVNGAEDGLIFGPAGGNITFEAQLSGPISVTARLQYFSGGVIDPTSGLPVVDGSNPGPKVSGFYAVGMGISGAAGDIVDLAVHGTFDNVKFAVPVGTTPDLQERLYWGTGSSPFGGLLVYATEESFVAGTIVSTPTLVQSYPGFYDVYEATVFVDMPWLSAYYKDENLYNSSQRLFTQGETGTVEIGEIVKMNSTTERIERWDVGAGDTTNIILGVTTTGTSSSFAYSPVCLRGLITIPETDVIGGASANVGDIIYSDATNSYELTTNATSGIQIGTIVDTSPSNLVIDVDPLRSAGGATTGEKLDFTVRTDAYATTGDHEGIDLKLGGAASVTVGLSYYWNGDWNASDAVLPASGDGLMAMATDTGVGVNMMQKGIIQLAANPTGAVAGSVLYFESGTPGTLTATAPSASGNIVRVAGHAIDAAGLVYFDPSEDWLEII